MAVLLEDSLRPNMATRIGETTGRGLAAGAVMTPWATPWDAPMAAGRKPELATRAADLASNGVRIWFDPMTHALDCVGVGDFRFYDEYPLWGGPRGDLSTPAYRQQHVARVFATQDSVAAEHLAPTLLLHAGLGNMSALALELAREAISQDPNCYLSIAGTAPFWESGASLDAHVGALAGLDPDGWFLSVVRPSTEMPVAVSAEEVHGLCRTSRALSEDAPVHISYGDLAALPAVAAGATSVGSGWDQRQRMCSYDDYVARDPNATGGTWFARPTLRGLLGALTPSEAALLESRDAARVAALGGLPAPGPKETYWHHLQILNAIIDDLDAQPDYEARYRRLDDLYRLAHAEWPAAQRIASSTTGAPEWVESLWNGLLLYGATEGW